MSWVLTWDKVVPIEEKIKLTLGYQLLHQGCHKANTHKAAELCKPKLQTVCPVKQCKKLQVSMQGSAGLNLAHYNNPNLRGMAGMTQWRGPSSQEWPFRMPGQQGSLPQLSQQLGSLPQMSQQLGLPQMSQQQLGSLPQMGQQMALQPLAMQQQMAQQMQVYCLSLGSRVLESLCSECEGMGMC